MSRFSRSTRRPDHWASSHERARARAAERLAGDLEPTEAAWLDEHLAECAACSAIAAAYDTDRLTLRALRDFAPQPPRDLWARTAAAIERESATRHRSNEGIGRRRSRLPLGALSGLAVIALVIGVSTLSSLTTGPTDMTTPETASDQHSTTGGDSGSSFAGADPTPFAVRAGAVQYILREASGLLAMNRVPIDEVCPAAGTAGCPALRDASAQRMELTVSPRTVIGSPTNKNAIVVADNGGNGDRLILVALPDASASAPPEPVENPPTATFNPVEGTRPPVATDDPTASASTETASPSVAPSSAGGETAKPSAGADPSFAPASQPTPALTPEPTFATSLAIASDIEVVGESAAFSSDGAWFAFTARPADRSTGPDVYVWRVGDTTARNLTADGDTTFASWDGSRVVVSRPDGSTTEATDIVPVSVWIDPETGVEAPAGNLWLPAVDPTRSRALAWSGSVKRAEDGTTWMPADGQLEILTWSTETGGRLRSGPAADEKRILTDDELGDFDIRWDETGEWVAVWVADANDGDIGRLSLYRVDQDTGALERLDDAPDGVAALPGFSIGEGRLAWASPPGQEGEGSRIQIVAWSGEGVGSVESAPGEDIVIIR